MDRMRKELEEAFSFMSYAPILLHQRQDRASGWTSCLRRSTLSMCRTARASRPARLNEMLARATARVQPPSDKGKRLKIFYITQSSTRPPTFVCFVNQKALFHFSYQRYIENQIRENFGLTGTPIRMMVREHGDGSAR